MKLLVRNLARASTEKDIEALFKEYGAVQYCSLVMDEKIGISKGFAFVEMPKVDEAKAAIVNLNNTEFDGARIRVKKVKVSTAKTGETPAEE
ncbi:MAG: RNA-binding protein [Hellea sp.]|nr:RNA-binding protein [Hellea sp.]